jgi:hypothetical protein
MEAAKRSASEAPHIDEVVAEAAKEVTIAKANKDQTA